VTSRAPHGTHTVCIQDARGRDFLDEEKTAACMTGGTVRWVARLRPLAMGGSLASGPVGS